MVKKTFIFLVIFQILLKVWSFVTSRWIGYEYPHGLLVKGSPGDTLGELPLRSRQLVQLALAGDEVNSEMKRCFTWVG